MAIEAGRKNVSELDLLRNKAVLALIANNDAVEFQPAMFTRRERSSEVDC
jgi:hypothetical protein